MSATTPIDHFVVNEPAPSHLPPDSPLNVEQRRGGSLFIMDFGREGNSALYRGAGWSGQEDTHVWSIGASSTIKLPRVSERTPLLVDIDFDICRPNSMVTTALLRLYANGIPIGTARAQGRSRMQCAIPIELVQEEPIELRLDHPCYARVDYIDAGKDDRVLGLCLFSIAIYPPWLTLVADQSLPHPEGQQRIHVSPASEFPSTGAPERTTYRFPDGSANRIPPAKGWRLDESGNAWADARECYLEIPAPQKPGHYAATFEIVPLSIRTVLTFQRISVTLNGAVIGQFRTSSDSVLTLPLPSELIEWSGALRFGLILPDGAPIHDLDPRQEQHFLSLILDSITIEPLPDTFPELWHLRIDDVASPPVIATSERFLDESLNKLPSALKGALGADQSQIMRQFESLGDNCAFGLAQRKTDAEVLGLLRFGSSPLKNLLQALDDEFRALTDTGKLDMRWQPSDPGEFMLFLDEYGLRWHTNVFDASTDQATLFGQQSVRLTYLRRKFYEGLKAARKIFAIARAEPLKRPIPMPAADELPHYEEKPEALRFAEIMSLFLFINRYGSNTLLFLVPATPEHPSGHVELLAPGIMRGYVESFVISQDTAIQDHVEWLRVAANAWLLDRGPNASFRKQ